MDDQLEVNEKSVVEVEPKHHHAFQLRAWYTGSGRREEVRPMTAVQNRGEKRSLAEAFALDASLLEDLPNGSKRPQPTNIHNVVATVVQVQTDQPLLSRMHLRRHGGGEVSRLQQKGGEGPLQSGAPVQRTGSSLHPRGALGRLLWMHRLPGLPRRGDYLGWR